MQPQAADNNFEANVSDKVNLDGISDRGNYGALHKSFELADKFSTLMHLGPGAPVPMQDPKIEPALGVASPGFQHQIAPIIEAPRSAE